MTGFRWAQTIALVAGAAAIAAAVSANAAPTPDIGRAAVVRALTDCRPIADDAGRLACYDKAVAALDQAESQGKVVVIDQEQAKAVRRQAFGFNLPTLNIFNRGGKGEEGFDHLDLDIARAYHGGNGKWVFVATNEAVWRQTDSEELALDPHAGSRLLVKNGALGSFFCKLDGQPQIRCERVK
jgi:hypothetical protein